MNVIMDPVMWATNTLVGTRAFVGVLCKVCTNSCVHTYIHRTVGGLIEGNHVRICGHHNYLQRHNKSTCWRGVAVRQLDPYNVAD